MKAINIALDEIYIPIKLVHSADAGRVETVADEFIETGRMIPVRVRHDGKRYVLVNGVHRVEACKALGEKEISAYLVQAIQH